MECFIKKTNESFCRFLSDGFLVKNNAYFVVLLEMVVPEKSKKSGSMLRNLSYYGFYQCLRSGTVPGCHQLLGWSKIYLSLSGQPTKVDNQTAAAAGLVDRLGRRRHRPETLEVKIVLAPCCTYLVVLQRAVVLHLVP